MYDELIPPPDSGYDPIPENPGGDYWTPSTAMSNYGNIPENPGGAQMSDGVPGSGTETAGNWLQQTYQNLLGPGSFLGGTQGAFPNQEKNGWLGPLMSMGSGVYGMYLAQQQRKASTDAMRRSSPWFSSGGVDNAGTQLTRVINGDFAGDGGYDVAQQAAARTSAGQPGGFAASAAATAALRYQNERISALGGPAGIGFAPQYGVGIQGMQGANDQASRALGSIGYGMTGNNAGIPAWLTQYLIRTGLPAV